MGCYQNRTNTMSGVYSLWQSGAQMGNISTRLFPDTVYIPYGFPKPGANLKEVRANLYWDLMYEQKSICPVCKKALSCDIIDTHESLVTRGDVQGWPLPWRVIIHNIYNCVNVHRPCHDKVDPQAVWDYKCRLYGKKELLKWWRSLPFKSSPPGRFILE